MAEASGLYGSDTAGKLSKLFFAELIGTYFLVLVGTATAVAATLQFSIAGGELNSLSVALAFGLTLIALVFTLGHISGAHFNPAVTIGLALIRKFPLKYVGVYVFAQLLGAFFASLTVLYLFGTSARSIANLGATQPIEGVSGLKVFVIESIATFLLMLVIMAIATDKRTPKAAAGTAIGFTLSVGVLLAGPLTGGALNPARAIAPMILSGHLVSWVSYIVGPIAGAFLAATVYDKFLSETSPPEE